MIIDKSRYIEGIVKKVHVSKIAYLINSSSDAIYNGDKVILPFMICNDDYTDEQFIEDLLDTICYEERQGYRINSSNETIYYLHKSSYHSYLYAKVGMYRQHMWSLYTRFHNDSLTTEIAPDKVLYGDAIMLLYLHHDADIQYGISHDVQQLPLFIELMYYMKDNTSLSNHELKTLSEFFIHTFHRFDVSRCIHDILNMGTTPEPQYIEEALQMVYDRASCNGGVIMRDDVLELFEHAITINWTDTAKELGWVLLHLWMVWPESHAFDDDTREEVINGFDIMNISSEEFFDELMKTRLLVDND